MTPPSSVASVISGPRVQRESLDAPLTVGEDQINRKVGFGSSGGLAALGLEGLVIGHLLATGPPHSGEHGPVTRWVKPGIEPQIGCWVDREATSDISAVPINGYVGGQ